MVLGVGKFGVLEECRWDADDYCQIHNVHLISEGFRFNTYVDNIQQFNVAHNSIESNSSLSNSIVDADEMVMVTADNVDGVLKEIFGSGRTGSRIEFSFLGNELASEHIKNMNKQFIEALNSEGEQAVFAYVQIVNLFLTKLLPLRRDVVKKIGLMKNPKKMTQNSFQVDLLDYRNDVEAKELLESSGYPGTVKHFYHRGRYGQMLTRKLMPKSAVEKIFKNETPEKELRATKLEACLVEIVYTLKDENIVWDVYAKGWAKLSQEHFNYLNKIYSVEISPWIDEMHKIVAEINNIERLIKNSGRV
jgi:hypothetical protein